MVFEAEYVSKLNKMMTGTRFVDLSPLLEIDIPHFPSHPPLVIHQTFTHAHDGYYCQTLFMAEHAGAHVDAPFHIHSDMPGETVESMPVNGLIGRAVVIDLSGLNVGAGECCTGKDIERSEKDRNVTITGGDIVLINFGWLKKHWSTGPDWKVYAGNSPGLDKSAAEYLLSKRIKAVGTDTIAVGAALKDCKGDSYIHDMFLLKNVYLMECIANLEQLPGEVFFMALPLKIKNGSGSPIRPIALVPRER